eukprot:CAMPEP_0197628394 /NCGR_PEP_ID=MMETSP1338-20131121/6728_1 /TAXON_ID=43686 ORGANISM="Pelagodinium beii, Strain RCC1491" /NCGR_SAMPLE_ID=MMETSP1338 /ASSEMBLY_ACC=CAM_ASM_000754 /LENGTH=201 /DNA_ID=CAMNT_0043199363 /DNA_START=120 /DNA_END=725 /DNA_ORIENTATION=-
MEDKTTVETQQNNMALDQSTGHEIFANHTVFHADNALAANSDGEDKGPGRQSSSSALARQPRRNAGSARGHCGADGDEGEDGDDDNPPLPITGLVPFIRNRRASRGIVFVWGWDRPKNEVYVNCIKVGPIQVPTKSLVLDTSRLAINNPMVPQGFYHVGIIFYDTENGRPSRTSGNHGVVTSSSFICSSEIMIRCLSYRPC